ncbi:MAG: hypothetical protein MJE68_33775 [Proteobacteria bacterium]|nr:hypothetical protein [Pseudomonadota bacterium]
MPLGSFSATQHYHSAKTKVRQGREGKVEREREREREREERRGRRKERAAWVKGESERRVREGGSIKGCG